jgi:hypothetical protein
VHIEIVCFMCFRGTLQVLYIDVAKLDRDVAHVVMAIHMFQVNVSNISFVLDECCRCFI